MGKSGAGKDFLKNLLVQDGWKRNVSYTTRSPRPNEKNGIDYHFITKATFLSFTAKREWLNSCIFDGHLYGTRRLSDDVTDSQVFILSPDGLKQVPSSFRSSSFVVFLDTPQKLRVERLSKERKWTKEQIEIREASDDIQFKDFDDYDLILKESTEEHARFYVSQFRKLKGMGALESKIKEFSK